MAQTQQQCINGNNPLYDWCMKSFDKHESTSDKDGCVELCDDKSSNYDFLSFLSRKTEKLTNDEIKKKINELRRENLNLSKLIEEKGGLANKRNLEILNRKDKETYEQIIYYTILLVIGICFGIVCIYKYFNLDTK